MVLDCRWGTENGWNYLGGEGGGGAEVFPKTFKIGGVKIKLHCGTLEI